jgi:uncharacterized protein YbdZ (MbtH family)
MRSIPVYDPLSGCRFFSESPTSVSIFQTRMADPFDLVFYNFDPFCQSDSLFSSNGSLAIGFSLENGPDSVDSSWFDLSPASLRRGRTRRGDGFESKNNLPDQYDGYLYKERSISHARLVGLGYPKVSLIDLVKICSTIESVMRRARMVTSPRNRAAKWRMLFAFHWLDENWRTIRPQLFDVVAIGVLR